MDDRAPCARMAVEPIISVEYSCVTASAQSAATDFQAE
jgi:hypothetical protein